MVNIPTNYKMGTGLAASLFGGQAGLEQEKMGLENLSSIMKQPGEALEAEKNMALLNDPNFVKANAQFQMSATQAKLGDAEKQKAINGLDILLTQLKMADGDPQKQQQLIYQSFIEKGVDPTSPMAQAIMKDPYKMTLQARDDLVKTMGYTPEVAGKMRAQEAQDAAAMEREKYKGGIDLQQSRISAGAQAAAADKNLRGQMIQYSGQLRQELDGLNNNITKLEGKELDSAIMQDFMNRGKKDVTQADVDKAKGELKADLVNRRNAIQQELDSVRTEVRGKLGMKQPAGTKEQPIVLTPTTK